MAGRLLSRLGLSRKDVLGYGQEGGEESEADGGQLKVNAAEGGVSRWSRVSMNVYLQDMGCGGIERCTPGLLAEVSGCV